MGSTRAAILAFAVAQDSDAPPGRLEFWFPTATAAATALRISAPPTTDDEDDWLSFDVALADAAMTALDIGSQAVATSQDGARSADLPLHLRLDPVPATIPVGTIFGRRWFSQLGEVYRHAVIAWLRSHDLVIGRDQVGLLGKERVVIDLRIMELDGYTLAVTNDVAQDGSRHRGQKLIGVPPDEITHIMRATLGWAATP